MQRYGTFILLKSLQLALGLSLLTGYAGGAIAADEEQEFYRNKQVEIVVGTTPGDAYDLYARIMARFLGKYIPGNPTFVVKNMPGAGGLTVSNYLYNQAPRDGTVISAPTQSIPIASLLAPSGVRYDPTKFSWIGSISKDIFVAYTRPHRV